MRHRARVPPAAAAWPEKDGIGVPRREVSRTKPSPRQAVGRHAARRAARQLPGPRIRRAGRAAARNLRSGPAAAGRLADLSQGAQRAPLCKHRPWASKPAEARAHPTGDCYRGTTGSYRTSLYTGGVTVSAEKRHRFCGEASLFLRTGRHRFCGEASPFLRTKKASPFLRTGRGRRGLLASGEGVSGAPGRRLASARGDWSQSARVLGHAKPGAVRRQTCCPRFQRRRRRARFCRRCGVGGDSSRVAVRR